MNVSSVPMMYLMVSIGLGLGACAESGGSDEPQEISDTTDETEPVPELNFEETVEDEGSTFAPQHVLDVRVSISDADWNQLRFEHRDPVVFFGSGCEEPIPDAFNYYPAEVTIDDESLGQVGVRTKGLIGSINPARPSLKVKLQEYQDELLYKEQKRFTFNNQTSDQARLSTCMAYYIFRKMGVPASRCNFAHIHVNDADMGVYANVEAIKKPMLERLFGDDSGNLYEGTVADIRTGFDVRIEKKTNEAENDWSDLEGLIEAVEAPGEEFVERVGELVDIDAFLKFTAASMMVGHWDSFSGNANNYYFYHDPTSDKIFFIPWGPDDTFTNTGDIGGGRIRAALGGSLLARRLFEDPAIRTRYRDTMRSMLNERWDDDEILGELSRMEALIGTHVVEPDAEAYAGHVDAVRSYLTERKRELINAVNADPIPFSNQLPESPVCMQYSGDLNISFQGTWDTLGGLGSADIFSNGAGSMTAAYGPMNFSSDTVGSQMGEIGSPGATELDFIGLIDSTQALFIRLMMPTEVIKPNHSVEMSDPRISSLMVLVDLGTGGFQILGFLGEGQFTFGDEVNLAPGGIVEGDLTVAIWGGFPAEE